MKRKIRIGDSRNCYWKTITTGQLGNKTVETKQIETNKTDKDFLKELISINGIGKKTAKDIIKIFINRENLKKHIKNNENIPIRDDIEKLLREHKW